MTVAAFIADQRTSHAVPHAVACRALGISESWFYKWAARPPDQPPTPSAARRAALDEAVAAAFRDSGATYGSPRVHAELVAAGWACSVNTVADSMHRQGLAGRVKKRRKNLTRAEKTPEYSPTCWAGTSPPPPRTRNGWAT